MEKALEKLSRMEYPGRVIIIGTDRSGQNSVVVYAITGRSPSSQARIMELEADTIWTKPTQEKTEGEGKIDLLIYPAISLSGTIAVSNGIQTTDIEEHSAKSRNPVETLVSALRGWEYEHDSPIFTSRISGCVLPGGRAALSIIKRAQDASSVRFFFEIPMIRGKGKMIATYSGETRDPLLPFAGEPLDVILEEDTATTMAKSVYDALKPREKGKDYRVAVACVFSKNPELNEYDVNIINRQERMKT